MNSVNSLIHWLNMESYFYTRLQILSQSRTSMKQNQVLKLFDPKFESQSGQQT